jgi:hypothetical protein
VLNAFLFVEHGDTYWKKLLIEQREQMQGVNTTPDLIGKKAGKDLHRQLLRSSKCTVIFWQVEPVMDLLLAIHKKRHLSPPRPRSDLPELAAGLSWSDRRSVRRFHEL